jgi:sulfhydrogenase subunit beta (sulfur reductase)
MLKKLSAESLCKLVDKLIAGPVKVMGVQARGERFAFDRLKNAADLRLDYDVTILPPKKYFQPQAETLCTFTHEEYRSALDVEPMIIIGIHPYDMAAINQMDVIFSQDEYDLHYMGKRLNATIIAVDVARPSKHVFASSMGTAVVHEGYDMLLTDVGDGFIADAPTVRGKQLLGKAHDAAEVSDDDLKKREAVWQRNLKELNMHPLHCKSSELSALLNDSTYNHPVWEEKAAKCFSCGSCNTVCPTCYCFDVQDDVDWDLRSGKRLRAWDGCLLRDFTRVAGDHVFRKTPADRFRHRLYRKAKYVPGKIGGEIACVGCGRCVGACVPDIANPVEIYNRIHDDLKK